MKKEEAISYLQQLYPNGGHCWLDDQRMEAIGMAVKALQEEPVSEEQVKEDTMTIRKEWFEHCKKSWYNEGYIDGEYNRDRQFKKPVNDDANKAAEQDVCEVINTCSEASIPNDNIPSWVQDAMINEFTQDAKWKTEQFEKEKLKQCNTLTKEQARIEQDFVMNFIRKHNYAPTFLDAIEHGMKMQKEQMRNRYD